METFRLGDGFSKDILEEIVGDFTTSMSPTLAEEVTPQNDGSVIIDGTATLAGKSTKPLTGIYLKTMPARLMASFLKLWEEIPVAGTRVHIGEYDIDILDVQDR